MKPKLFIGSSSEALEVAEAVAENLQRVADCRVWTNDVFRPSKAQLDDFKEQLSTSNFAILILSYGRARRRLSPGVPRAADRSDCCAAQRVTHAASFRQLTVD